MPRNFTSHGIPYRFVLFRSVYIALYLEPFDQNTLLHPDERQLSKGIKSTNVPAHLQSLVDSLVWESTRTEEGYVSLDRFDRPIEAQ
jgi:hypothetical protein